jgi:hypothetical protein
MTSARRAGAMGRPVRHPATAPPLDAAEIAVLLQGWGAAPPTGERLHTFDLFDGGDSRLAGLWRDHEPYLRRVAAAWHWVPTWWVSPPNALGLRFVRDAHVPSAEGPFFFGEACLRAARQSR